MKIIDKTPLLDEKGDLGFTQRIQGMLQFGFNWPNELQAQKTIINFFDRSLEKGYTLIRNQTLGQSGIMIPMILLGPAGLFVINVTHLRGRYKAKGDSWNVESGNQFKPAPVNLIQVTSRMTRALQKFIERQGIKIPAPIESVLIAADPGLHIESLRPAVKVMMVDGIKSFVSGLTSGAPALRADAVLDLVERITNPRPPKEKTAPPPQMIAPPAQQPASRARAIFNASDEGKPFNAADFDFALAEEEVSSAALQGGSRQAASAGESKRGSRRLLGMTIPQLMILVAIGLCLVCILVIGIGYLIPRFS